MNFEAELQTLVSKMDGAQAAVLMGFDGIMVAQVNPGGNSSALVDVAIEFSRVLKESVKIAQGNDLGEMQELTVATAKNRFAFRVVNTDYFVGLLMNGEANVAKGRYLLRLSTPSLALEL